MFDPSLQLTSQRRLTGSIQNGKGERVSGDASLIKANEISDPICIYPTSNPVDSTALRQQKTSIRNKGTPRALSRKVEAVRRYPNRKRPGRGMSEVAKAQSNV
jgi:hypothetical protein